MTNSSTGPVAARSGGWASPRAARSRPSGTCCRRPKSRLADREPQADLLPSRSSLPMAASLAHPSRWPPPSIRRPSARTAGALRISAPSIRCCATASEPSACSASTTASRSSCRSKRRYGYYVFPVMRGEAMVGRLDAKAERESNRLFVRAFWPERGVSVSAALLGRWKRNWIACAASPALAA
jgi:hypothetical protein